MVKDITFHYTKEEMVKGLINLISFDNFDTVLDAGSGKNKIWYNNIPNYCLPSECEIEDGVDFFEIKGKYDWIIGNPPFHLGWKFLEHACNISNKGIAFLGNLNFLNSCLPNRFELLKSKGFYLQKIHIVQDKRWFGRYYFLIFNKKENNFISWHTKSY
ncbi:MAG: hypothetical protein ACYC97_05640 [Metallibacterium sp.]